MHWRVGQKVADACSEHGGTLIADPPITGGASSTPKPGLGCAGHRSITSTAIYTALAPNRFKDFWRD